MGKFSVLAALGVLVLLAVTRAMPQSGSESSSEETADTRKRMEETAETRKIMEETTETREITKESTRSRSYMGQIRKMCRNNTGSDDAYIALTEEIGSAFGCVMTSFDLVSFISDVHTISHETRTTFFPKYCPQLKRAGSCLDDLLNAARPCLEEESYAGILAMTSMYPGALDLICKNDGEIIFKLAEPKTKECVNELRGNVRECTIPFAIKSEDWDISNLTATQLGAFSELRQCMEDKLNVCEAPDLNSAYGLFHNTLFRLPSCNNVHPFIGNAFVPFVQLMSSVTKNETNTVNED